MPSAARRTGVSILDRSDKNRDLWELLAAGRMEGGLVRKKQRHKKALRMLKEAAIRLPLPCARAIMPGVKKRKANGEQQ